MDSESRYAAEVGSRQESRVGTLEEPRLQLVDIDRVSEPESGAERSFGQNNIFGPLDWLKGLERLTGYMTL